MNKQDKHIYTGMFSRGIQGQVYKGKERAEKVYQKVYCSYLDVLCRIKESNNSIIVTIDICKISKQDNVISQNTQPTHNARKSNRAHLQFRPGRSQGGLLLVTEQPAQDLAAGALGDGLDKFDASLEPLVTGLVVFHVLLDGLHGCLVIRAGRGRLDHDGLGDFTGRVVGDGDDGAVGDSRVGEDVSLEFGGCNLQPLYRNSVNDVLL